MSNSVAATILEQIGGNRFIRMVGANNFVGGQNSLSCRFMKGKNNINAMRITLDPNDTYTVEFFNIWGTKVKSITKHREIYCEMLEELFESNTGLYLRF